MKTNCFHCGSKCDENKIKFDEKHFCCKGCSTVYQILNSNNLSEFYQLNNLPGLKPEELHTDYKFLDSSEVFEKVIDFSDQGTTLVTFFIPVIHCTSCVWLLESLNDINENILHSNVNFIKKTVQITFKHNKIALSEVAKLVTSLGYQPRITLDNLDKKETEINNTLIAKIAIAGFCFGNVMLFALPEYLENYDLWLENYTPLFRWFMLVLSLPVIFYCATDYFKSAWNGIKNKVINIDIPISIGILAQFFTSIYESFFDISNGYFDSLCGLVFFMLLGKYFQQRTYQSMSFDRDYKSFYPISVVKLSNGVEKNILLSDLKKGDRILIRNMEIIPADCILIDGNAFIDNSFITGESVLINKKNGDKIYAGAKQFGEAITLDVINDINQSYLTDLWNHKSLKKETESFESVTNLIGKYFIIIILFAALFASIFWYFTDASKMLQVASTILIVACPCALSLSIPFTLGNVMRLLGSKGFYVKDTLTLERITQINHIVFDKTGTLTENNKMEVRYEGKELSNEEKAILKSIVKNSNHPLSRYLYEEFKGNANIILESWKENLGKGLIASFNNELYKLGSNKWLDKNYLSEDNKTKVLFVKNNSIIGEFVFENIYRTGIKEMISSLPSQYKTSLLSGDSDQEKQNLSSFFKKDSILLFNQNPEEKLNFIKSLKKNKEDSIMMIGDGLNDAGALHVADVGIALSDNINSFSPSCDVIMNSNLLNNFTTIIYKINQSKKIILASLSISLLYNAIGLSFAICGKLNPLVAAILMPLSSISVVLFTSIATNSIFYKFKNQIL